MATVFIADDSPVARHRLCRALRAGGVYVIEASTTGEALRIDANAIDAAILDLDLGDGDGVTLAEWLRAKRSELPLAFYSSETEGPLFLRAKAMATIFPKEQCDEAAAWAITASKKLSRA